MNLKLGHRTTDRADALPAMHVPAGIFAGKPVSTVESGTDAGLNPTLTPTPTLEPTPVPPLDARTALSEAEALLREVNARDDLRVSRAAPSHPWRTVLLACAVGFVIGRLIGHR